MADQSTPKRLMCPSCFKPASICLCTRLKTPIVDNAVAVTILRHSLEKNHPLNTTRIASIGLRNLNVVSVSDVNSEARFEIHPNNPFSDSDSEKNHGFFMNLAGEVSVQNPWSNADSAFKIGFTVAKHGVITSIFPHPNPINNPNLNQFLTSLLHSPPFKNGFTVKKFQKKPPNQFLDEFAGLVVPPGSVLLFPTEKSITVDEMKQLQVPPTKNLVVLDGTWAKAKRMLSENPWLQSLPHLRLEIEKESLYGEVRHQPRRRGGGGGGAGGCLSSIESIVYGLKGLGGKEEEEEGLDGLLQVFEAMVEDQRRCKEERLKRKSSPLR